MERIAEPELMDESEQARAYAMADFAEPHNQFITLFQQTYVNETVSGTVLDLGCGPADVSIRFAKVYPDCDIIGIDGAEAMLRYGRQAIEHEGLSKRIKLIKAYLPVESAPPFDYTAVISNSLLHHLRDPMVLWQAVKASATKGTRVFIMDLMRPTTQQHAKECVKLYASEEAEILQHDFYHSLLAAYRPKEIIEQLHVAMLDHLTLREVSDRHMLVTGIM